MKVRVQITLKPGVLDPQGKAIKHALESLNFSGVNEVRQGKFIEIESSSPSINGDIPVITFLSPLAFL